MIVSPSILSADIYNLEKDLEKINTAEWIHIDVMDGVFVPNLTFGANVVKAIRPHTSQILDCHLMVEKPEKYIASFEEAGADIVSIQAEATHHPHRVLQQIKDAGMKAGLALNPGTSVSSIESLLPLADLIVVMTVNPGFGGQAFITDMTEKMSDLRDLRENKGYSYQIQIDGGVNDQTALICKEHGADVLVSGSYIFSNPSPQSVIADFQAL